jgi:hypothetical protein
VVERACTGEDDTEGVEVTGTIAPDDLVLGVEVLHRETKWIKLDRNKIISGEFANRKKIFDEVRCN